MKKLIFILCFSTAMAIRLNASESHDDNPIQTDVTKKTIWAMQMAKSTCSAIEGASSIARNYVLLPGGLLSSTVLFAVLTNRISIKEHKDEGCNTLAICAAIAFGSSILTLITQRSAKHFRKKILPLISPKACQAISLRNRIANAESTA